MLTLTECLQANAIVERNGGEVFATPSSYGGKRDLRQLWSLILPLTFAPFRGSAVVFNIGSLGWSVSEDLTGMEKSVDESRLMYIIVAPGVDV